MPGGIKGKYWKFARSYRGPFRVVSVTPTNAEVVLVDRPNDDPLFMSLKRVRPCYEELSDTSWTGHWCKISKEPDQNQRKRIERQSIRDLLPDLWRENKEEKLEGKL